MADGSKVSLILRGCGRFGLMDGGYWGGFKMRRRTKVRHQHFRRSFSDAPKHASTLRLQCNTKVAASLDNALLHSTYSRQACNNTQGPRCTTKQGESVFPDNSLHQLSVRTYLDMTSRSCIYPFRFWNTPSSPRYLDLQGLPT